MEFHEVANLFPLMEGQAFADFVEDVRKHGLLDPIIRYEGKILDGRNRYRACLEARVPLRFTDYDGDDPAAFAYSRNLQRFQYSTGQKALVGAAMRAWYDKQAKERQRQSEGRGKKGKEHIPYLNGSAGQSRDHVGKIVGVSGKTIDAATKVLDSGIPELKAAVAADRIGVSTAALIAAKSPERQRREIAEPKARESYRKPKDAPPPEEPDSKPTAGLKGVGVILANKALNHLTRIPKNDPLRKRGFQIVTDWIRDNP